MKYVGVKTTGELRLRETDGVQTDKLYMAVEDTKVGASPIKPYQFVKWDGTKWVKVDNVELATTLDTKNIEDALAAAVDDLQGKIDEVTLDPSAVALGNVHLLDELTEFPADGCILVDSETNGPGEMHKDKLLELTAQNALAGNVAKEFDPTRDEDHKYLAGESVVHGGKIYTFKVDHYGAWDFSDVYEDCIDRTFVKLNGLKKAICDRAGYLFSDYPNTYTAQDRKIAPKEFIGKARKIIGIRFESPVNSVIAFGKFTKGNTLSANVYGPEIVRIKAISTETFVHFELDLDDNDGVWFQVISGNVYYTAYPTYYGGLDGSYNLNTSTDEKTEGVGVFYKIQFISDYSILGAYLKKTKISEIDSREDFLLSSYPTNLLAGYYWANNTSVVKENTTIKSFRVKATPNTTFNLSFGIFTLRTPQSVTDFSPVISTKSVTSNGEGVAVFELDEPLVLLQGQGVFLLGSTTLKYSATNIGGCYYIKSDGSSVSVGLNSSVEVGIAYDVMLDGYALNSSVESINSQLELTGVRKPLLVKNSASSFSDISMGGFAVDSLNGYIENSTFDLANSMKINKYYSIEDKRISIEFVPKSTSSKVYVAIANSWTTFKEMSAASVDFSVGKIAIYQTNKNTQINSVSSLSAIKEVSFTPSNVSTDRYLLEFEQGENWSGILRLYNITRQKELLGELVCNEYESSKPYPKHGFMNGYPIICTTGDGIYLYKLSLSVPAYDDVRFFIAGDSITEGYGSYTRKDAWSYKAKSAIGRSVVSAKSGGTLSEFSKIIQTEIPILKPSVCLIAYGHNDVYGVSDFAAFRTALENAVSQVKALGIEVVLACMPRTSDVGVDSAGANDVIMDVAKSNGLNVVRFDIATSTGYNLSNPMDSSLFFDSTHPNENGYKKMFVQFESDCSEYILN